MSRDKSIAVSEAELDALNAVAAERFGDDSVPYGATISHLITQHTDVDVSDD